MRIGVPKEIKNREYRVGLTPGAVRELVASGHEVVVESKAGIEVGFDDKAYQAAGATIAPKLVDIYESSEMIVKVKEPQSTEIALLKPQHILFAYLHLAADPELAKGLLTSGAMAIAYETVTDAQGRLPLLLPMSEVAGRMSVQVGAHYLERENGGKGLLLGGVPGVRAARVCILGGGVAGTNAAKMAIGLGADVTILERSQRRLRELNELFGTGAHILFSTQHTIDEEVACSDLVIGAVLIPGDETPKLVSKEDVRNMEAGTVLVDIAIDQGGCFETSHPTTHDNPVFVVDDVVHYCVTNMPGAVPRTSTLALVNSTLPYVQILAREGKDVLEGGALKDGVNIVDGRIVHPVVADALEFSELPN